MEALGIGELSKKQTKVDTAISIINYQLKKKQKRVDDISRRVEITESQKIFIGEEVELITNVKTLVNYCKNDFYALTGKLPPGDKDLEMSVLGSAIWEDPFYQVLKQFLKPEHFHKASHQDIWQAALDVGGPIDYRRIIDHLRRTGKLEIVGGPAYVVELTAHATGGNIVAHAAVLIEMAVKRELILLAGNLLHGAYDDLTDCFEMFEEAQILFSRVQSWIDQIKNSKLKPE